LLMQIRTGHIPLNAYLYRIKKSVTSRCNACWERGHWTATETTIHYLFECQAYAAERYDMSKALGRHARDLQGILSCIDRVKELLKFLGRTGRFKETHGNMIGDVSQLESEEV